MKQSFEITLAGQKITVKTDADDEVVRAIVGLVDERLERAQKSGATTGQKAALLVALSLAEDVVALKGELASLKNAIAAEAAKLNETVTSMKSRKQRAALPNVLADNEQSARPSRTAETDNFGLESSRMA